MEKMTHALFPYSSIREVQDSFMLDVKEALEKGSDLIVHAPTGLGKTVGALAPALAFSLEKKKKILFLTSRHTQHNLAVQTLKDIRQKHDVEIKVADIIGKRWMCPQPGTDNLYSGEFAEFCRTMKESGKCEFYARTKKTGKLSVEAQKTLEACRQNISDTEKLMEACAPDHLCAYEIALELASVADVMILDYYYIFNPTVSKHFMARAALKLEDCIIIVDEAHNLPARIMELATSRLSSNAVSRAIREAEKHGYPETAEQIRIVMKALDSISEGLGDGQEKIVKTSDFTALIQKDIDYDQLKEDLEYIGDSIRETQRQSYIGSIAQFLTSWTGPEEGFSRIISLSRYRNQPQIELCNHCLDPSTISRDIIDEAYSTILMSGTLTPTSMYNDLLGFDNAQQRCYKSPFPDHNRLNLIVPKTTTKFSRRNELQFRAIAEELAKITDIVPGNSIAFFPSYYICNTVNMFFSTMSRKTVFLESPELSKQDKAELLENFKKYQKTGAVMLAVASGSFAEGIDLPGDLLKCVVVVGLPLQQPDLRTRQLIEYYDRKFGKGWDYGYLFPAFNKALQSAGRCIRSETDRGIMVFLDERYLWPNYIRCFPPDWELKVAKDYSQITGFFEKS